MRPVFRDRVDAGRKLATLLMAYASRPDVVILGLPRGGIVVAAEVARMLHVPMDALIVRKLGVPGQEELAMGAVASGGIRVLNAAVIDTLHISKTEIERVAGLEQKELERRERLYRDDRPLPPIRGRTVILVDDGIATGATLRAAIAAVRALHPAALVGAAPVAAPEICDLLRPLVDDLICYLLPEPFWGIGAWYQHFEQVSDDEVRALLASSGPQKHEQRPDPPAGGGPC